MTTGRRKRHNPEQVVRKVRNADAMLNSGKELAAVLQGPEVATNVSRYDDGMTSRARGETSNYGARMGATVKDLR